MKPSSSTNVSRTAASTSTVCETSARVARSRLPHRFLATFLGVIALVFFGVNFTVLEMTQFRRYRGESEYAKKMRNALDAYAAGRAITTIFAGDSTVSVGIMPRILGPDYLNVAWSGFDPSELERLKDRLLSFPVVPSTVFIGINPTFLSENEWGNLLSVPPGTALLDGIESFYEDTNSFKPLVIMGGIASLSNRFLVSPLGSSEDRGSHFTHLAVEPDGRLAVYPDSRLQVPRRDHVKLRFRRANYAMVEVFRSTLAAKGIRVIWLCMPYSRAFERALREGNSAREFRRYRREIDRIFGDDVIDLSGTVPDELFRDEGHLMTAGSQLVTEKLAERLASSR
jgi:hypothetical protein